jgi:hypothetical protein
MFYFALLHSSEAVFSFEGMGIWSILCNPALLPIVGDRLKEGLKMTSDLYGVFPQNTLHSLDNSDYVTY